LKLARLREKLFGIREKLGGPGASGRVADIALDLIKSGAEVSGSRLMGS